MLGTNDSTAYGRYNHKNHSDPDHAHDAGFSGGADPYCATGEYDSNNWNPDEPYAGLVTTLYYENSPWEQEQEATKNEPLVSSDQNVVSDNGGEENKSLADKDNTNSHKDEMDDDDDDVSSVSSQHPADAFEDEEEQAQLRILEPSSTDESCDDHSTSSSSAGPQQQTTQPCPTTPHLPISTPLSMPSPQPNVHSNDNMEEKNSTYAAPVFCPPEEYDSNMDWNPDNPYADLSSPSHLLEFGIDSPEDARSPEGISHPSRMGGRIKIGSQKSKSNTSCLWGQAKSVDTKKRSNVGSHEDCHTSDDNLTPQSQTKLHQQQVQLRSTLFPKASESVYSQDGYNSSNDWNPKEPYDVGMGADGPLSYDSNMDWDPNIPYAGITSSLTTEPQYDSNVDWDPEKPYAGLGSATGSLFHDPEDYSSQNEKQQPLQRPKPQQPATSSGPMSSLFSDCSGDKSPQKNKREALAKADNSLYDSKNVDDDADDDEGDEQAEEVGEAITSLFGVNTTYNSNAGNPRGPYEGMSYTFHSNQWNPDDPYGGLRAHDTSQYHSNNWNPNEPDASALDSKQSTDNASAHDNKESTDKNVNFQGQHARESQPDEPTEDSVSEDEERDKFQPLPSSVRNKRKTADILRNKRATSEERRKKFDFDKFDKQINDDKVKPAPVDIIREDENDIIKWLGGIKLGTGDDTAAATVKHLKSESKKFESDPNEENGKRKIRFAAEAYDLETGRSITGSNDGSYNPRSSLASDDTHPKEILRNPIMDTVPENSVAEAAALNFNTIVMHNRLNPSSVPEPVLSSSLESSNHRVPYVRKWISASNGSGSDSKRTRFSDEHTAEGGPKRNRKRFWALVCIALVALGGAAAIVAVVVFGEGDEEADTGVTGPNLDNLYANENVVSSNFTNPTEVTWNIMGEVLNDFPEVSQSGNNNVQAVSLSADGTKLAVGAWDGTAHVYQWDASVLSWKLEKRLEFPSFVDRPNLEGKLPSVALSGNGRRVAMGLESAGRVYIYDYQEDGEDPWLQQVQPIIESQSGDGTGASVALSHDGNLLAVGAPYFDGTDVNSGQIRLFTYDGVAWRPSASIDGENLNDKVGGNVRLSPDGRTVAGGAPDKFTESGFNAGYVWAWQPVSLESLYSEWAPKGAPLTGLSSFDLFGYQISLSMSGRVMAISSPGYATGVVFVFGFDDQENVWKALGSAIPAPGSSFPGVCLSADGKVVAVATNSNVKILQYQASRFAVVDGTQEWVEVGSPFSRAAELSGNQVACSADGRIVVLGRSSPNSPVSTVTVLKALEP